MLSWYVFYSITVKIKKVKITKRISVKLARSEITETDTGLREQLLAAAGGRSAGPLPSSRDPGNLRKLYERLHVSCSMILEPYRSIEIQLK
jgi:hypothetical protein